MDRHALQDFARRDWQAVAASKAAYWTERFHQHGWRATWQAADALWLDMHLAQPDFPTDRDRVADCADHAAYSARLARAAHAFIRR